MGVPFANITPVDPEQNCAVEAKRHRALIGGHPKVALIFDEGCGAVTKAVQNEPGPELAGRQERVVRKIALAASCARA